MGLETGTYISDLVSTNPVSSDPKSQGDDHIRFVKATVKATFPNVTGAVTATQAELNIIDGATLSTAELNILTGATLSTAELNILDGATLDVTELNYVDGVTSAIQTQLDLKAPLASPVLTGVPEAPTAAFGASGTQLATLDFVNAVATNAALPAQTGNADKILTTDGTNATWDATIDTSVVTPVAGTAFTTNTQTQTLTGKTLQTPIFQDSGDTTKKANLILSGVTAGQNRNITLADENMTLFTGGWRLLSTVTASNSATVDIETTFDSTYDSYVIVANGITVQNANTDLYCRMKLSGAYDAGAGVYTYKAYFNNSVSTASAAFIKMCDALDETAAHHMNFTMWIHNASSTSLYKTVQWTGDYTDGTSGNTQFETVGIANHKTAVVALTGIRFLGSSGNIVSGSFKLYGVRKT